MTARTKKTQRSQRLRDYHFYRIWVDQTLRYQRKVGMTAREANAAATTYIKKTYNVSASAVDRARRRVGNDKGLAIEVAQLEAEHKAFRAFYSPISTALTRLRLEHPPCMLGITSANIIARANDELRLAATLATHLLRIERERAKLAKENVRLVDENKKLTGQLSPARKDDARETGRPIFGR